MCVLPDSRVYFEKVDKGHKQQIHTYRLTLVGAILGCVIKTEISVENIVYGAFSGLASTGMHQVFKQLLNDKNDKTK